MRKMQLEALAPGTVSKGTIKSFCSVAPPLSQVACPTLSPGLGVGITCPL